MPYEKDKAVAALLAFQKHTGLKDDPWEKASDIGEGTLRRFHSGPTRSLRSETYEKLAAGAGKLMGQTYTAAQIRGEASLRPASVAESQAPYETVGTAQMVPVPQMPGRPDVPVWASAEAGRDGAMILVNDPIDWIRRSERMQGVKSPFAFYVIGSSMSPAIEHGDQVVINPSLLPIAGKDHVFIQQQADGTMLALVKRLLRVGSTAWKVRQFNPPEDFDLPKNLWGKALVISEKRVV